MGPPKCEVCGGATKPLFQSFFCPKDCDRIPEPVATEKTLPVSYGERNLKSLYTYMNGLYGIAVP
jgi:hypothetical protein